MKKTEKDRNTVLATMDRTMCDYSIESTAHASAFPSWAVDVAVERSEQCRKPTGDNNWLSCYRMVGVPNCGPIRIVVQLNKRARTANIYDWDDFGIPNSVTTSIEAMRLVNAKSAL